MEFIADLHPLVIHFPIAFLFLYLFLDFINLFWNNKEVKKNSLLLLLLGVIGGIVSVLSGNLSYQILSEHSYLTQVHYKYIDEHEFYASLTMWYFFGLLIIRSFIYLKKKNEERLRYLFVIFAVVGAIILYETARFGGKLVYDFGIGTELIK